MSGNPMTAGPSAAGSGLIQVAPADLVSLSRSLSGQADTVGQVAASGYVGPTGNPHLDGGLSGFDIHFRSAVTALSATVHSVSGAMGGAAGLYPANDNGVGAGFGGSL